MKSLSPVTLLLIFYLCFVKAETSPLVTQMGVSLHDEVTNFLEIEQHVGSGVLRLQDEIARNAQELRVEEELAREMSIMRDMARKPLDYLRGGEENSSLMETRGTLKQASKQKHMNSVKLQVKQAVKQSVKKASAKTVSSKPAVVVDSELDVLRRMQNKYNPSSDSQFTALLQQPVVGYEPVKKYEDGVFLQLSEQLNEEDLTNLFDFHEPSASMVQTSMREQAVQQNAPIPNSPGWPFSSPPSSETMYKSPDYFKMPTGSGYVQERRNSLSQGASEKTNNLVDSDNIYNNYNNARVNNYRMNGGVPADVLLQQGQTQPAPQLAFNGYRQNGIVQGAFAPLPGNIGDNAYNPPENTMTQDNPTPGRPAYPSMMLESQKQQVPYFPEQKPLPLSGNSDPVPPSVQLSHGTVHQFSPNPDQTPISAQSQDALVHLGHTGKLLPSNEKNVSPFQQGFSFLQNDGQVNVQQPGQASAPPYSMNQNPILPRDFQKMMMDQRVNQPGYFPHPNAQVLSPTYAGQNRQYMAGPVPGTVPSLYPVDNLGLHVPLARDGTGQAGAPQLPQPYGPYTSGAPQQYINHIEVNPELHPVQYMADTPYFPTEAVGENILPPAPIEQPVQAGGPMAGFQDPRVSRMGNVYIPSAPYQESVL